MSMLVVSVIASAITAKIVATYYFRHRKENLSYQRRKFWRWLYGIHN